MAHLRRWSAQGSQWLVRVKAGSELRCGNTRIKASKLAENLNFEHTRRVLCKGQSCEQWTAGTSVVLARPARPKRLDAQGQWLAPVKGEPLALRLVVSKIVNEDGDVVAMWYLLSNAPEHIEDATLALWYYFRWQVESFFKLLKSAGHQLESWQQETALAGV